MPLVKTAYLNILEAASVSLAAGAADSDFPLARLYDRDIGRLFKTTAAVTTEVLADQGASPVAVDRLLIPSGHNLDGETLDILWSTDDISYTPAVSQWVQSGSGLINKSWAALTKRYWKFKVTSPSAAPEIAELFLTSSYEWPRNPTRPAGMLDPEHNVTHGVTAAGNDRFLKHGSSKRRRSYRLPSIGEAQKDAMLLLSAGWDGSKPFWMYDHEGAWIFGRLASEISLEEVAYQTYRAQFNFMEVLP